MNKAKKLKVCKLRLQGESIRNVAQCISVTPQTVSNFLRSLPSSSGRHGYPSVSAAMAHDICRDYIRGVTVPAIASKYGLQEEDVYRVFWRITVRKPIPVRNSAYRCITDWMQRNAQTMKNMAKMVDLPATTFGSIIAGKTHMPISVALKLREITGITLTEIFGEGRLSDMSEEDLV